MVENTRVAKHGTLEIARIFYFVYDIRREFFFTVLSIVNVAMYTMFEVPILPPSP